MSRVCVGKTKILKISKFLLIFLVVTSWVFSGWPRIWQKPPIPPEVQVARAVCEFSPCSYTTSGTFTVPAYDTLTVTVWGGGGGGGAAGSAGATDGNAGGQSSFNSPTPLVANGGSGGVKSNVAGTPGTGGGGGTASGGDTNTTGNPGADGSGTTGGNGGNAPNGGTGGAGGAKANGSAGGIPGAGGGGGGCQSGASKYAGGGGGSGGYTTKTFTAGQLTGVIDVVVGGGGNGGSVTTGYTGGNGARGQIDISWTAVVSLYIKDKTVDYTTVAGGACSTTTSDTQYIVNNGSGTETFNIKGADTTDWDIGTSSPGTEIYTHLFSTTTETTSIWKYIDNEYVTLETGIAANGTSTVDFYIFVPSSTASYGEQSTTITVQAVAE